MPTTDPTSSHYRVTFARSAPPTMSSFTVPPLQRGQVMIRPEFAGINPTDVYHQDRVTVGTQDSQTSPGVEVAGTVLAVGPGPTRWTPGDRAFGLVDHGGLATAVIADSNKLAPIPDDVGLEQAAAVPEVFITAHDALRQGRLSAGEVLLVNGATGAVGQAAVQLGLRLGARVYGGCRSAEGAAILTSLGARPHRIDEATSKPLHDCVDVVIELVGGVNLAMDLASIRMQGRIVAVAAQGEDRVEFSLRDFKTKRTTLIGSTLRRRGAQAKAAAVRAFEDEVLPLLATGQVTPTIARRFPMDQVAEAFAFMRQPSKHGKVLLDLRSG